jgi:hypothetical protein
MAFGAGVSVLLTFASFVVGVGRAFFVPIGVRVTVLDATAAFFTGAAVSISRSAEGVSFAGVAFFVAEGSVFLVPIGVLAGFSPEAFGVAVVVSFFAAGSAFFVPIGVRAVVGFAGVDVFAAGLSVVVAVLFSLTGAFLIGVAFFTSDGFD